MDTLRTLQESLAAVEHLSPDTTAENRLKEEAKAWYNLRSAYLELFTQGVLQIPVDESILDEHEAAFNDAQRLVRTHEYGTVITEYRNKCLRLCQLIREGRPGIGQAMLYEGESGSAA